MRCFFAMLVAATMVGGAIFPASSPAQSSQDDRGNVGRVRPVAPGIPVRPSGGTPIRPSGGTPVRPGAGTSTSSSSSGPVQTPTIKEWRPTVVPYSVYPYGIYTPYGVYSPGYWYGDYYPYYGSSYYPPVVVPATGFGPDATRRFLNGVGRAGMGASTSDRRTRDDGSISQRGTSPESLTLAGKFIGFGDNNFAAQRYNDANQRYKKAAEIAPGLADAYFRQGFALIAMGRYESAVKALKRGLDIEPKWAQYDFRLATLYRDSDMAKRAHLDALAKAATEAPTDVDLLFLVGVFLYFDGQTERAAPFFQRAAQLGDSPHLKGFLAQGKE